MESEEGKRITSLGELSQILILGEGGFHLRHIQQILKSADPENLSEYILTADAFLFRSLLYYIRLFRNDPEISVCLNDRKFSIFALERILLAIHMYYLIDGKPLELLFSEQLFDLENDRILELLIRGNYIPGDQRISLNLISRLDREHLERFVREKANPIPYLGDLIKKLPEDVRKDFLFRNPELYGYLKLFFEFDESADPQVLEILLRYQNDIEEAMRTLVISKKYSEESKTDFNALAPVRIDRIQKIVDDLKHLHDRERALELLSERGVFASERERLIVKNILLNPFFVDILDSIPEFHDDDMEFLQEGDLHFF